MEIKIRQRAIHEKVATLQKKNAPLHTQLEYVKSRSNEHHSPICVPRRLTRQHKEYADAREDMKRASKQKFDRMKAKWGQSQNVVRTSSTRDLFAIS
jgi:predicted nuclease with TOPRIM domain